VRAEWTKLRTLASTWWLLVAAVAGTAVFGALMTVALDRKHCGDPCVVDTMQRSLYGVRVGQIAVAVLAVLAVANEFGTGMVGVSVTAVPRRAMGLLAKLVVVTATALAAGAIAVAASLLAGALIVPRRGFAHLDLTDWRPAVGSVLYLALIALLASAIAVIVRDTGGAVAAVLAVLYTAPLLALMAASPRWQHRLHRFSPMDAGLAVQAAKPPDIGPWAGLGVLALYAAAAVLVALLVFERRDV
jgi:ABC-2 type transport system permease protein